MIVACAVTSPETEAQACLLAESVRANGGRYAASEIWLLVADGAHRPSEKAQAAFGRLDLSTYPFEIGAKARGFPFAGKVLASAATERLAQDTGELLVWLDPDSIVFHEPAALLLEPGKALGCRPVDHVLIGSPYDEPADEFWTAIYQVCDVTEEQLFPMTTSADQIRIRPYINAGMLVVQPEIGLFGRWQHKFLEALGSGLFEPFFARHVLYRIFLHQAILAGVIVSTLQKEQIQILSHLLNYPMHMHQQVPANRRPARMNDLISGRYDTFFQDPAWGEQFPSDEPFRGWLARQVTNYGLSG